MFGSGGQILKVHFKLSYYSYVSDYKIKARVLSFFLQSDKNGDLLSTLSLTKTPIG